MDEVHELVVTIESHIPLVVIESHDEARIQQLFTHASVRLSKPVFSWSVTAGLLRLDGASTFATQTDSKAPEAMLDEIKATTSPGIYLLMDFHPYVQDPLHTRMIKELALNYTNRAHTLVFVSHQFSIPEELKRLSATFELSLPSLDKLDKIVREEANAWSRDNPGRKVKTDSATFDLLIKNLKGVSVNDARRLARKAIYDDGQITPEDIPRVAKAKYDMLDMEGVLSFEYDTAKFSDVGGLQRLKRWLEQRRGAFHGDLAAAGLDAPKGIMLLGVQGGGKSLAAKSVAGMWGIPLLRLDFGALYNRFYGETERNLRQSLKIAEAMEPCVLWMDEIEKGLTTGEDGPSQRVLGTLLTWMAERKTSVFMVATANDITSLPPELMRKGRFDEIFFVDLPDTETRSVIFRIHLNLREHNPDTFDLPPLAAASTGFSGAEIEQAIVSGLYAAQAENKALNTAILLDELQMTRPLSVVMAEKVSELRQWAASRTVPAN